MTSEERKSRGNLLTQAHMENGCWKGHGADGGADDVISQLDFLIVFTVVKELGTPLIF